MRALLAGHAPSWPLGDGEDPEIAAAVAASWADRPLLSDEENSRLLLLDDRDWAARPVPCPRCGAMRNEPCIAPTGLQASEPCSARLADARAAAEAAVAA